MIYLKKSHNGDEFMLMNIFAITNNPLLSNLYFKRFLISTVFLLMLSISGFDVYFPNLFSSALGHPGKALAFFEDIKVYKTTRKQFQKPKKKSFLFNIVFYMTTVITIVNFILFFIYTF